MPRRARVAFAASAASLATVAGVVLAEPLPKEDCDRLLAEQSELTTSGVRDHLARGPAWGKANLSPPELKKVERFIFIEEQLSFRCGFAKLRATLPIVEEGGDQELDEKGNPIPAKGEVKEKDKPPLKSEAPGKKAAGKTEAKGPPAKSKAQASGANASVKPKPKLDDAYRPPTPKDPSANPFAPKVEPK